MKWNELSKNHYVFKSKIVFYSLLAMLSCIWGGLCFLFTGDMLSGEFVTRILWGEWVVYTFLSLYTLILAYIVQPTVSAKARLKKNQKEAIAELMRVVKVKRDLGI